MRSSRLSRAGAAICVGLDLAGVEARPTGVAVLRGGRLVDLKTVHTDAEVLAVARLAGLVGTVAINAPLTRPAGRCCLDDDCPCRTTPGTRSRRVERDLGRLGVPTLATALIKVLARRGRRIGLALRVGGVWPLEAYPHATLKLLGLPCRGKRTAEGRRAIHDALATLVPGLDHPEATDHQLDAVASALTADLWRRGLAREVGDPAEGVIVVPSCGSGGGRSRSRRTSS